MTWYSIQSYCSTEEAKHLYDHVMHATSRYHALCKHLENLLRLSADVDVESIHIRVAHEWAGIEEKFCRVVDGRLVEV